MTDSRRTDVLLVGVLLLVALCAWLLGGGHAASPAAAAASPTPSPNASGEAADEGIRVSAQGTVSGRPDVLRLNLGVEIRRSSVDQALAQANAAMSKVRDALRRNGVATADLQTSSVDVSPVYDDKGRTITAYVVTEGMTAKIRDLAHAGRTIDAAANAGGDATRINGVEFAIEDNDALLAEARKQAFAAARDKAALYADQAGRPLGSVVSISEAVDAPAYPMAVMDTSTFRAAAMPIEPGQQKLVVTVTVSWRFG